MIHRLLLCLLLAGPALAANDPNWAGEIVIALRGGLPGNRAPLLHLEYRDGKWAESWGEAYTYNTSTHYVKVLESAFNGDELTLKLDVTYRPDFWIKPAAGVYSVTVKRGPTDNPTVSDYARLRSKIAKASLNGTFSGSFTGYKGSPQAMTGEVVGLLLPWREPPPGFAVAQPGEHPRMLFRKTDLPALRERLKTPLGEAVLAELEANGHEVATAILYQLTGDAKYAAQAFTRIATGFTSEKGKTQGYGGSESEHVADYPVGHQAATAFVYDLCYDGWTVGQRKATEKWLAWMAEWAVYKPWSYSNKGSTASPISHSGITHAGGAIITWALWGIPSPPPPEPAKGDDPLLAALGGAVAPEHFEQMRATWREQMELWKEGQGMDLKVFDMFRLARRGVSCLINEKMGEGGSVTSLSWPRVVLDCAISYRNMFGADISARNELRTGVVAPLMETVTWRATPTHDQPVSVTGPINVDPSGMARLLVLAPPEWRPMIENYWLRMVRMQREELTTVAAWRTFFQRSFAGGQPEPWGLLYALQYFGAQPADKQPPLPRVWETIARGELFFRGGTLDEPILITMDANTSGAGGAELSGGNFEISAFGQRWTAAVPTGRSDTRARHNVVHVPGQRFNGRAKGKITYRAIDPSTANGALSLDLSEFCKEMETRTVSVVVTQKIGAMSVPKSSTDTSTTIKDVGLRASRAMAVDFSGKCGAPALLVIADRFEGPREKCWLMNTPDLFQPERLPRGQVWTPPFTVKTDANTFELRKGDASVRGVFVAPAGIKPAYVDKVTTEEHIHPTLAKGRGMLPLHRAGLEARVPATAEPQTDFLVIITVQKGPAPEVKGTGREATVGGVPVRYDGDRIVIGK